MFTRFGLTLVCLLALNLAATGDAFAQKTKTKNAPPAVEQVTTLDPSDPDDLEAILDEADAAYFTEDGVDPDYERAFELYKLAGEAGDAYAMNRVALMYDRGEFVALDYEEAFDWYLNAAEAGLPAAQSNVGSMYSAGDGVKQDYAEAMKWFRMAADNGYAYANFAIGDLFLAGNGVAEDAEEATAWYRKASDAGDMNGDWALSIRYLYGDGVGKDTQRAAELAYLALTKGLEIAYDELKDIGNADTSPNFRRSLQELLKRDGYYTGTIDGSFGPATQRAVEAAYGTAE